MYRDIIHYELAEGISEAKLMEVAEQIVTDWMQKLPGFIQWEIHKSQDGTYTDIVSWATEEDAKNGEKEMVNIPNATDWYGCYKPGSISSSNITLLRKF